MYERTTKTYYFRNAPGDFLFSDLDLLQKQPLTEIIPHLHKNRTVVLIFSDGGAARGGFNQGRVDFTAQFLSQIRPVVKNIAWLNPLPANRWRGTTAAEVAKHVSMYPFSKPDWRRMMNELRGRQIPPAVFDYSTDNSEVAVDWEFVEEVQERLNRLQPVHTFSDDDEFSRYESAADRIVDFAMYGRVYLEFACHAAFPLALTPNLLYYLRENFPFFNQQGKRLDLDWLVVPDLLLSNLCHPAGYQLYEMPSAVRHLLLKLLQSDERFGDRQLEKLSECLLFYLQQKFRNTHLDIKDFGENPEWIALAYTKPTEVARQLALMLLQTYSGDKAEKIKSVSLIATFTEPLAEAKFQPLLTFARGWGRLARGYNEDAKEVFEQLPKKSPQLNVEGVKLWIPGRKLPQFSFSVVTVNATGEIIKRETHQAKYFREDLGDGVTLDMVYIPGGSFLMGSPETEEGRYKDESPQHEVTVQPFFMGKYPVTQKQWRVVAALAPVNRELDPNPSHFKGVNRPVESISWYDAVEFCDKLSTYTGKNYRLPSEAEWEYACRARTTTPFHFGETITSELANYDSDETYASGSQGKSRGKTTTVGSFKIANAFGLFDMHGNIWEWCADSLHENYENAPSDGNAWLNKYLKDNDSRMLRGGSWSAYRRHCRSARRDDFHPDLRLSTLGFRVVLSGARIVHSSL
ncbi:SUMF1/EgtB/PvdO family nonheme iron enzyme [Scytonema sp. UIC 10036]|uniref:formylglycine-generating enzyme family protein n=1 Tax=Scytonema sp. UIC 10036 TaxID=2304196 RepID=UPI0012DAB2F8|nr:SUMF1/EgtB/PvdO family nonheme iron enzyme [Scytonema sp. UIC 10036]MUG95987.1 SUMF1/EgtB/PvdO family nonheme iron enzyme [Scytonema sp. UIC 10036]